MQQQRRGTQQTTLLGMEQQGPQPLYRFGWGQRSASAPPAWLDDAEPLGRSTRNDDKVLGVGFGRGVHRRGLKVSGGKSALMGAFKSFTRKCENWSFLVTAFDVVSLVEIRCTAPIIRLTHFLSGFMNIEFVEKWSRFPTVECEMFSCIHQDKYVLRLVHAMEEVFFQNHGVSSALVADVHRYLYKAKGRLHLQKSVMGTKLGIILRSQLAPNLNKLEAKSIVAKIYGP